MSSTASLSSNTSFAFKLFAELARQDSGKNIFISPASIALALAMTYNGARGETQRAMAAALELGTLSRANLNRASAELLQSLAQLDPAVQLVIASSLWARAGITFSPDFVQRNQEFYQAALQSLDFSDPRAVATINAWVQEHTSGKIAQIVDQIGDDALLFLINAIYFKGDWTQKFEQRLTKDAPFTLPDGQTKPHPLMSQSGEYRYYAADDFQAISLPYGGRRLSMYIFLPSQHSSLAAFVAALNSQRWSEWMHQFDVVKGRIALPRFKLEYEATLNAALQALGMAIAFSPSADFGGMCAESRVRIDVVKHKTFVEVNEQGTEAAAVTSAAVLGVTFISKKTFSMIVDRPFFFAIRDNPTGAILFMGSIVDP